MRKTLNTLHRAQEWLRGHGKKKAAAVLSGLINKIIREAADGQK